jgi:hypothetical protein
MMMNRSFTRYHGTDIIEQGMKDVSWSTVRRERDQALAACDWRALKDVVLPTAWKEYRQALRDLGGFASSNEAADNWPVAPDE